MVVVLLFLAGMAIVEKRKEKKRLRHEARFRTLEGSNSNSNNNDRQRAGDLIRTDSGRVFRFSEDGELLPEYQQLPPPTMQESASPPTYQDVLGDDELKAKRRSSKVFLGQEKKNRRFSRLLGRVLRGGSSATVEHDVLD